MENKFSRKSAYLRLLPPDGGPLNCNLGVWPDWRSKLYIYNSCQGRPSDYSRWAQIKRQCTYKRNIEVRTCNHCCNGKNNKYYIFWVYLYSLKCNAHVPYPHLWHVLLKISFYIISQIVRLSRKESYWTKICVFISSAPYVWNTSHFKKNWVRY